jgi:hypothetical protein
MAELWAQIGNGVIAGILTAGILVGAGYLFKEVMIPWYQSKVYEGVSIAGTWHADLEPEISTPDRRVENDMTLDQHGHKVTGSVIKRTVTADKRITEDFTLEGRIRDRFFYGYMYSKDNDRLSALSFLYQVEGNGSTLSGLRVFYHIVESEIKSLPEVWYKQEGRKKGQAGFGVP